MSDFIDPSRIAEWKKLLGEGRISVVGEYTPDEFWEVLGAYEVLQARVQELEEHFAFQAGLTKALRPYQKRAVKAEVRVAKLEGEAERQARSIAWHHDRWATLQAAQMSMRDPERKAVCDILANGSTTALDGEAEQLREDAERYRWIMQQEGRVGTSTHIQEMWAACKTSYPSKDEWNAAIDAARGAKEGRDV